MTVDQFIAWERNEGCIDFNEEEYYTTEELLDMYKQGVAEHYNEIGIEDNHDYTFEDFTYENDIYAYSDLDYIFMEWDYHTIYSEDDHHVPFVWLVITTGI